MLQYTLNFVIYAARSDQYRAAYLTYLKKKLPLLFGLHRGRKSNNTVFIINHRIAPEVKRTASNPEKANDKDGKNTDVDVRVEYSLDLQYEKVIHTYTGSIKVESVTKPTIIIMPGGIKQSGFTSMSGQANTQDSDNTERVEFSWTNNSRIAEVDEDEMSSEDQVETIGVDKEYRSEYCSQYLNVDDSVMKRAFSF